MRRFLTLVLIVLPRTIAGQEPFSARRDAALARLGNAVLIVASQARPDEAGLRQTPDFYYLTGLEGIVGAALVLDGASREASLFYPAALPGPAGAISGIPPGRTDTAGVRGAGLTRVETWEAFAPHLSRLLAADSAIVVYLDAADPSLVPSTGTPLDTLPDHPQRRWREALARRWPAARIEDGRDFLYAQRAVKDSAEIHTLRRVGERSAAALLAGLAALAPGARQRAAEGAVIAACLRGGGRPSFWPWVMSGPAGAYPTPWRSLLDPSHLDRTMRSGELARVDVGCEVAHYMGDVGRTAPVAGRFDPAQREAWELLVAAYRAGLRELRAGVRPDDVIAASFREVARRRSALRSPLARHVAEQVLAGKAESWQLHGVGLEDAEPPPDTLRAGTVVAYEPIVAVDGQGFYLEDMLLVTPTGYEVLTPGLPYTADEIEAAVRRGR